jgi:hypothetical protein
MLTRPGSKITIARIQRMETHFQSAAFLCTFGTTLVFWLVYAINRDLIIPPHFMYDYRLNHMQHTFPLIASIVVLLTHPQSFVVRTGDFCIAFLPGFTYMCFLIFLFFFSTLPYDFMKLFKWWHFVFFLGILTALAYWTHKKYANFRDNWWKLPKVKKV